MSKADAYYKKNLNLIMTEGSYDENPRTKYLDGVEAKTKFITQIYEEYNISNKEFPIPTLRNTAIKTGIKEILWIYQKQSNSLSEARELGINWWDDWDIGDGTIGRAYGYNMESHRHNESVREIVDVPHRVLDVNLSKIDINIDEPRVVMNIGYLGNYLDVKNFTEEEVVALLDLWGNMFSKEELVHYEWHSFETFLRDVRYLPQYHLAKDTLFEGWVLTKDYYSSNMYSKETCVFEKVFESELYDTHYIYAPYGDYSKRYELSRNQINELLFDLERKKFSRRHMTNFWNWANNDKKGLIECAFSTLWSVRVVNGVNYLDLTLTQRSNDYLMAGYINKIQYVALQMMVAGHLGYEPGKFGHFVQNLHIYDRHNDAMLEIINREPINDINPSISLINKRDFYSYSIDDFKVSDVKSIPKINSKLEIAV